MILTSLSEYICLSVRLKNMHTTYAHILFWLVCPSKSKDFNNKFYSVTLLSSLSAGSLSSFSKASESGTVLVGVSIMGISSVRVFSSSILS